MVRTVLLLTIPLVPMGAPNPTVYPGGSDGSESVDIPISFQGGTLYGVFVWFEYGDWILGNYGYCWQTVGVVCSAVWIGNPAGHCFAKGTGVMTPSGYKAIEQLIPGDIVYSSRRDDLESNVTTRKVARVQESKEMVLNVRVKGQTIQTTGTHPLFAKGRGWTAASLLKKGDLLRTHANKWVEISSIADSCESTVYNIVIDGQSGYFVGGDSWGFSVIVSDGCSNDESNTTLLTKFNNSSVTPNDFVISMEHNLLRFHPQFPKNTKKNMLGLNLLFDDALTSLLY